MGEETYITNLPEDIQWMIQGFVHKSQMASIKKEIVNSPLVLDEDCRARARVTRWLDSLPSGWIIPRPHLR